MVFGVGAGGDEVHDPVVLHLQTTVPVHLKSGEEVREGGMMAVLLLLLWWWGKGDGWMEEEEDYSRP